MSSCLLLTLVMSSACMQEPSLAEYAQVPAVLDFYVNKAEGPSAAVIEMAADAANIAAAPPAVRPNFALDPLIAAFACHSIPCPPLIELTASLRQESLRTWDHCTPSDPIIVDGGIALFRANAFRCHVIAGCDCCQRHRSTIPHLQLSSQGSAAV